MGRRFAGVLTCLILMRISFNSRLDTCLDTVVVSVSLAVSPRTKRDTTRQGRTCLQDSTEPDTEEHDQVWHDRTGHDRTRQDRTGLGKAQKRRTCATCFPKPTTTSRERKVSHRGVGRADDNRGKLKAIPRQITAQHATLPRARRHIIAQQKRQPSLAAARRQRRWRGGASSAGDKSRSENSLGA